MSETAATSAPAAPAAPRGVRPFYWSVRRELWEHPSICLAPLLVAAVALFGSLIGSWWLLRSVRAAVAADHLVRTMSTADVEAFARASKAAKVTAYALGSPYNFVAGSVFLTAVVVVLFYASGALYGERRDRTILFWKSLPVSDVTTVLAKVTLPLAIAPLVVIVTVVVGQLAMLAWSCLMLVTHGMSAHDLTRFLPFPYLWLAFARGMIIMTLWQAPLVCWILLVSGWAKRVAFLWAVGPFVAICIVERIAFNSTHVFEFLMTRLAGAYMAAFTVGGHGGHEVRTLADLNPLPVLADPQLWGGLAVAALCVAAAVRLRRYRDPI